MLKKTLGLSLEDDILLNDGGVFYNGGCFKCEGKKEYISIPQIAVKNTISIISKYDEVNIAVQMVDEFHGFRITGGNPPHFNGEMEARFLKETLPCVAYYWTIVNIQSGYIMLYYMYG